MSNKRNKSAANSTSTSLIKQNSGGTSGSTSGGTSSGTGTGTGKSGTYYSGDYNAGFSGGYSYTSQKPKKVFILEGIEFWGSSKTNLEDILLDDGDLIINCSGYAYEHKSFVKKLPTWMRLELSPEAEPHQVLLDWKDYSPPPKSCELSFWKAILAQAKEKGIKRIFCCCTGGQGRTGTALASFILATDKVTDPDVAIDFIREYYTEKAIESKSQENYLWGLICGADEVFGGAPSSVAQAAASTAVASDLPPPPPPTQETAGKTAYVSEDADEEWAEWVREWGYDQEKLK